jgi:hypothetical protein
MAPTTVFGLVVLGASAILAAGAAGVWRHAASLPASSASAARAIEGRVVDVLAQTCGYASRTYTCYRPVVAYRDGGLERQAVARSATRPASMQKGDAAGVLVFGDGTAWLASEWRTRQAEREREHASARRTPTVIGWLLAGCAACSALLGIGLIVWIDRSGEPA